MNTQSLECRKVKPGEIEKEGDFCFDEEFEHIYIWMPAHMGPSAIRIKKGEAGGNRVWGWDGNEEKPTLTPSLLNGELWHGHLQAGKLVSC